MATINLTNFSNDDLAALLIKVMQEQENRARLLSIPDEVQQLRDQYVALGGNIADLDSLPS